MFRMARVATLMLLRGMGLKTVSDQLGHSSMVLTADTYLSVAVELGLKSAEEAARLVLKGAADRPTAGASTGAPLRARRGHHLTQSGITLTCRNRRRGPTLPNNPRNPDNANPLREPGFRHAKRDKSNTARLECWSHHGPTLVPPAGIKNDLES